MQDPLNFEERVDATTPLVDLPDPGSSLSQPASLALHPRLSRQLIDVLLIEQIEHVGVWVFDLGVDRSCASRETCHLRPLSSAGVLPIRDPKRSSYVR